MVIVITLLAIVAGPALLIAIVMLLTKNQPLCKPNYPIAKKESLKG